MMVREAGLEDIPELIARAKSIHAHSVHAHIPFHDDDAAQVFGRAIALDEGCVLIGERGFFVGQLSPFHFNLSALRLVEMGWGGGDAKEIIQAACEWAKERGAIEVAFGVERTAKTAALLRLFRMTGGVPSCLSVVWRV
ncbi:MAG: hypothetical protein ABJN69_13030 [Hellea sp.]